MLAPFADVMIFCALLGLGRSLQASHIASFTAAMALNYLLKVRGAAVAAGRTLDWRLHCRLLAVTFMALFLRGGVLGLLSVHWNWPAQVSIVFAVMAGMSVTAAGYSLVLSSSEDGSRALAIGFNRMAERIRELRRSDLGKLLVREPQRAVVGLRAAQGHDSWGTEQDCREGGEAVETGFE